MEKGCIITPCQQGKDITYPPKEALLLLAKKHSFSLISAWEKSLTFQRMHHHQTILLSIATFFGLFLLLCCYYCLFLSSSEISRQPRQNL